MTQIDWAGVARNALWIVGLSVVLASWSWAGWLAHTQHIGLRKALEQAALQASFSLGLLLFSAGLAWGATQIWERIAWSIIAIVFVWQAIAALRGQCSRDESSRRRKT